MKVFKVVSKMTDIFSVLWGRKKERNVHVNAMSDDSFVSYIEKELTDDLKDFVLIDTTKHLYPTLPIYQTKFGHSESKMGIGSSAAASGKPQEICAQTYIPESNGSPSHENIGANVTQTDDEMYNVSFFLSDVPFELSSKLSGFQSFQSLKLDGFQYLNSKADMLENLAYDFELERAVLFETECAVTDYQTS